MEVKLKRPKTLMQGEGYLWREHTRLGGVSSPQAVTFVSYDPCPAFVIVRDEEGKNWRCPRDEIFTLETINQGQLFTALAAAIGNAI